MQIQAVILDLDGLMVDSEPLHQRAYEVLLARHGIAHKFTVEEYGRDFVGIPIRGNIEWLTGHFRLNAAPDDIIVERERIYEALLEDPANLVPMPGVFALIDALSARGLPLGVASGSPRGQVDTILRGLGIAARFRAVVAGTDVPRTKPAPDVYLRAAQELGIAPARCVAIEDSTTGVASAKAAGLRVIVIPNRYTAHQDLSQADARVESLVKALDWLD
ncbi:MAG: HAD family phosphatase [Chloroflexota bacterium]|nr:HAD family phosphatase [Chloroflexota bacterium]